MGEGNYGTVVKAKCLLLDDNGDVIKDSWRALKFSGCDDAREALARAEVDMLIEICKKQQNEGYDSLNSHPMTTVPYKPK